MNELQVYQNGLFENVRATLIDNEPWFVGSDVAKALEYEQPSASVRMHVDEEDTMMNNELSKKGANIILINEAGVYSLIFQSKQGRAKEFKHWITHEVLPSIRKTGSYSMNQPQLSEEKILELVKTLSAAPPKNIPYIIPILKAFGCEVDVSDMTNLLPQQRFSRPYEADEELISMLQKFKKDKMNVSELSRRTGIGRASLYYYMNRVQNTNPSYATAIKNTIRSMYAEAEAEESEPDESTNVIQFKEVNIK